MAIEITIPRLGWNMDEGVFHGWLKHDGDQVRAGDSLFTLESEKATEDIECLDSGILRIHPDSPKDGDPVRVGDIIGYLVGPGESPPLEQMPKSSKGKTKLGTGEDKLYGTAGPASRRSLTGETPVPPAQRATGSISPRARRLAGKLGVDWTQIRGSGRTGRIRERDVRAAYAGQASFGGLPPFGGNTKQPEGGTTNRLHRRAIAERVRRSLSTAAPVTLTTTADAVNLVNLRNQFKAATAAGAAVPSYTDFLVKLSAIVLKNHSALNARWQEGRIVPSPDIHIGIAVDTEAGLLAPVIRNVPALTLRDVAAKTRELIERARHGKLRAEAMQGGTFTISNLGAFGIDSFTPIINLPECAILGVGRIKKAPVVHKNQIVAREQVTLSLTFDHRIVDGAPAARFLQELVSLIESPGPWLIS
jgi:pyruvate dehydrogenase E2 component (dihydrolipoamide acetyltransferase)